MLVISANAVIIHNVNAPAVKPAHIYENKLKLHHKLEERNK